MSSLGKRTRLNRIFSHPTGRILSVAVDHLINYPIGLPQGLRTMGRTLEQVVAGRPHAITMNKGIAMRFMEPHAGKVPFIIQSMALRPEWTEFAFSAHVEEVVAMGADAIAVAMFLKGESEIRFINHLARVVRESEQYGLPVIPHIYTLSSGDEKTSMTHHPEDIFYAVRMGLELGADVIKVPFTGDEASFRDIVAETPVPVVAAGGPKCETLEEAVAMMQAVARTGAAGATVGRNVWEFPDIPRAIQALTAAIVGGGDA